MTVKVTKAKALPKHMLTMPGEVGLKFEEVKAEIEDRAKFKVSNSQVVQALIAAYRTIHPKKD